MNNLRIAIDGGAATGKTTISKIIAKKLNLEYINTGQMYRLFTFIALKNKLVDNEKKLYELISASNFYFKNGMIKSEDYSFHVDDLESEEIAKNASKISSYKLIREFASDLQKQLAKKENILLEGRDIGTIIMPFADYKFFLKINPEKAALRRQEHYKSLNKNFKYEDILKNILSRNNLDSTRDIAPLRPSKEAHIIDVSDLNIDQVIDKILKEIKN